MNFTAGLLLIFLNVFLPGLIFLRFYYTGEFSKQFSTKVPIIRLAFYALIPGLIFLLFGVLIYNWCDSNFTLFKAISIFSELLGSPKDYSCQTECFLKNQIHIYSWFTVSLNVGAFISAFFAHWLVRRLDWDIQFKLLRFKNQWYYVFNGDILKYKKYRALNFINPDEGRNGEIMMAYADILVNEAGGTQLYSGIIMDYDLDNNDNSSLEKIYLIDAHRHKRNPHQKKPIPGQIFVILNSNILNINLTYIPSAIHQLNKNIQREKSKIRIKKVKQKLIFWAYFFVIYCGFALFIPKISFFPLRYLSFEFNIAQKIYLILTFLSVLSVIFYKDIQKIEPFFTDDQKKKIEEDSRQYRSVKKGMWILVISNIIIILYELFANSIFKFFGVN